ncbi:RNA methyltransferase [Arenibacter sp. ARW7G5Y1]|uniref:TrmH family RNA methyltransferase n=1 Tax=Arenibacter sp. ARW7G5Y1 TaxID=2135619 RepID=UPI000D760B31|nr:RNA methyltransferase [Arenibacter sp. ARW7G5Y1]PXX23062.1 TrmH family RNA methyltransferase [Arenibacter sp. ARW7G5Y1]|tara:strand:- start:941 stop:1750 length:810 start_codon:yes stop_codon:yes gene_type:complete
MSYIKEISSIHNPLVRSTISLKEKSRERKKNGLFIIEGIKELQLAVKGRYTLKTILFYPELVNRNAIMELVHGISPTPEIISISKDIFQKLAYRDTTEGILAVAVSREHTLESLKFKNDNPLILVAEAPEKPGNIGALLRTADAAGLDAVIIANPKSDLYNPNIIRSSVGCVFTTDIAMGSTPEIIQFLIGRNININCAALSASKPYTEIDFTKGTAIVVGTEATGLSEQWLKNATQNIIIPMHGEIDSMNVSVSAAILIFEAIRQRGF